MENLIRLKPEYTNLDALYELLKSSEYECSKEYDTWEHRTDTSGQMAHCIVLKKNGMHAVKLFFVNENTVKINHIIPNKLMNAYFGNSAKAHKNMLELLGGSIKRALLKGAQQKAFEELERAVAQAS